MRRIDWSEKQQQVLAAPYKHCLEVEEGTPRSGKTTCGVARFSWFVWNSPDQSHMVLAYNQEQAYRLVMDCDGLGLLHKFPGLWQHRDDDFGKHILLRTPTGEKKIYYKGGGKADSHKSFVGISLGSVYFCEINLLHMDAIQEAFRRTMAAQIRWHIADLNPPPPNHPVISEVFNVQDTWWTHWTPMDNPALTPERRKQLEQTLAKNHYLYRRDWLGERVIPEGVIYSMFDTEAHILAAIPSEWQMVELYFAGDGGLTDATSVGCYGVYRKDRGFVLVRLAAWYYEGGNKAMSVQARELAGTFAPWCRQRFGRRESDWYIDPACKALRKELELFGIMTTGADNNAHDVKGNRKGIAVGIEYLQNSIEDGRFFLLENDQYGHEDFLREIGMYCVDANGNPVDAYNHAMDETRYAHNHFAKTYVY